MANGKVLMVLTSHDQLGDTGKPTGYWLGELTHPYFAMREAGLQVEIASIKGGKAPIDPGSLENRDELDQRFLHDETMKKEIDRTLKLENVNPKDYQAVFFTGGHGTMWDFPDSPVVDRVIREVYEQGGVVAAVCHGPAALVNVKLSNGEHLVQGRRITGFSNEEEKAVGKTETVPFLLEEKMRKRGAIFRAADAWKEHVMVDQRIVTGQNPQSAKATGEAVATLLK